MKTRALHAPTRHRLHGIGTRRPASFDTVNARHCAFPHLSRRRLGSSYRLALLGATAILVLTLGCAHTPAVSSTLAGSEAARQHVMDRIVDASVKVVIERDGRRAMYGSGIVIASRPAQADAEAVSYVLTAAHVVAGGDGGAISVGFCGSSAARGKFPAILISRGKPDDVDLALLRISGIAVPPAVALEDKLLYLGSQILVVGFPEGQRLGVSGGIVSQLPRSELQSGIPSERTEQRIVIDAAAPRGVSGGGVFDAGTGDLIGIVQGHQTYTVGIKDPAQPYVLKFPIPGSTFVVPMAQIRPFLAAADFTRGLSGPSRTTQAIPGR